MIVNIILLALGVIVGLASGVTAVYSNHSTTERQRKCHYTLISKNDLTKNSAHLQMHAIAFHGDYDFVGVPILPVRNAIFDPACLGFNLDIPLAIHYLKQGGTMSLDDLKSLRSYAIKNNKRTLVKLITSAVGNKSDHIK